MVVANIQGLTVQYGRFTALHDFSVQIPGGCIGLLGPNGAGKTTLIKTILGFVKPVAGTGMVMDADILTQGPLIRQRVGLMPEQDCHIPGMSAVTFVAYAGELAGMPGNQAIRRAHEVLEYCGLGEARYRPVETYSTGMKQRIKLAQALIHGPSLLLLDEPTNGLDPRGREDMLELIRSVSHGKNVNVIVSSHLLPDIERTCDEVIVVAKGELRAQGKIKDLRQVPGQPIDVELKENSASFVEELGRLGVQTLSANHLTYRVKGDADVATVGKIIFEAALKSKSQVRSYDIATRSLEDAFLEVIK